MAITQAQVLSLLVLQVGDYPDGLLSTNAPLLWAIYADKAYIHPRLQWVYTRLGLIDLAQARVREQIDLQVTTDQGAKLAEKFAHLEVMRVDAQAEISKLEGRALANLLPQTGLLVATVPIAPPGSGLPNAAPLFPNPTSVPDANSPFYGGSPYYSGIPTPGTIT